MSLLLVTTTKGRPTAFSRLCRYVEKQSTDDFDWLVVTDGCKNYTFPDRCTVVERDNREDIRPSICENWLAALKWIEEHPKYDRIINLDDDDWYDVRYIFETKNHMKDETELFGWHEDAYYYVMSRKSRRWHNIGLASLACTAFKRSVIPYLRLCAEQGRIDIDVLLWNGIKKTTMWRQAPITKPDGTIMEVPPMPVHQNVSEFNGKRKLVDNFNGLIYGSRQSYKLNKDGNIIDEHPRHVGLKQNWHKGLEGLSTQGHDASQGGGPDQYGKILKKWVGEEDAKFLLDITKEYEPKHPTPENPNQAYQPGIIHEMPMESLSR